MGVAHSRERHFIYVVFHQTERSCSMFCPNCGAKIPDDSVFCEKCGYQIEKENSDQQKPASFPGEEKSGGSKAVLYIVIVAIAAVAIGAGIFLFRKGHPEGGTDPMPPAVIAEPEKQKPEQSATEETQKPTVPETEHAENTETAEQTPEPQTQDEPAEEPVQVPEDTSNTAPVQQEVTEPAEEVAMDDFGWYYDGAFPKKGTKIRELRDLGGYWKSLISVQASSEGTDIYRLMLSEADIQYMGYKVTVLLHVKARYECPVSDRNSLTELETGDDVVLTFSGDWNEDTNAIEADSINSSLAVQIHSYAEADGVQYALGTVLNEGTAIGEIAFVRQADQ